MEGAAILGNVCMLPLYPGLIAFLPGNTQHGGPRRRGFLLGGFVLAGALAVMLVLGFVLFVIGQSFSRILPWLLPLTHGLAFGPGFGCRLLMLPLAAMPLQRAITRWLAGNSQLLGRVASAVQIAIALFGVWTVLLPNVRG